MTEESLLFSGDVSDPQIPPTPAEGGTSNLLWTCSDNGFRFDFFTDSAAPPEERTPPADAAQPPLSFTGQGSAFAFNFQIPPDPPAEDMDTADRTNASSPLQAGVSACTASEQSKTKKKKKKSGKKTPSDSETQQQPAEEELSAEEQLNRQLDWCIEQLELGIRSQKGTPKQKEEASRALKTLRSSKAPLVKKRQVMRAMTGDYRKKMEEEKNKQFRLIQSGEWTDWGSPERRGLFNPQLLLVLTETAAAQVQAVSDSPKKSVFHRRAEVRSQSAASEQQPEPRGGAGPILQAPEETAAFVFVPSKEEFHFNFL
uniref:Zgc:112185 n=1 Tax=Fundulus heteroclitus TaxID=8078 RepID=A0A146X330_FUNHE